MHLLTAVLLFFGFSSVSFAQETVTLSVVGNIAKCSKPKSDTCSMKQKTVQIQLQNTGDPVFPKAGAYKETFSLNSVDYRFKVLAALYEGKSWLLVAGISRVDSPGDLGTIIEARTTTKDLNFRFQNVMARGTMYQENGAYYLPVIGLQIIK